MVYAALSWLSWSFASYPIRVYTGWSIGSRDLRVLKRSLPFVAAFYRLLQTPEAENADELAPEPGESLIAQVIADLKQSGRAFVLPTLDRRGVVISLKRAHPGSCAIERRDGREWVVHRPAGAGGAEDWYPRRSAFVLHLLSWERGGQGELGVGAGAPLRHLVAAELAALERTADVITQGGADIQLVASSATGAAMLRDAKTRQKLVEEACTALSGPNGRRVFAIGGEVKLDDAGLKPADLIAKELVTLAQSAELAAIGVVPAALGATNGSYATAVQQMRSQAAMDGQIAAILEAFFLRPLIRHLARAYGAKVAIDELTAGFDLAQHPGNAHARTEALERVQLWIAAGWTNAQAAEEEGLDADAPLGVVNPAARPPQRPGPDAGSEHDAPRNPVGDGDGPGRDGKNTALLRVL